MFTIFPARLIFAVAFLVMLVGHSGHAELARFNHANLAIKSQSATHEFSVEIANSETERDQGLMFRQSLDANSGMLFLYPKEQPISMWMKNTFIPLDMIFIHGDGTISHIVERAVPQSLTTIESDNKAKAVLELNGGTVARLKIRVGDKVDYPAFEIR